MKSILYVAAAIMIGASIYGFVDYSQTKDSKEFAGMYAEKKATSPAIPEEKKLTGGAGSVNKNEEPASLSEEKNSNVKVNKGDAAAKKFVSKFKKKRKVNYESFSRAPLRDEVIVEAPEIKEETKKGQ